jgi:hypothetical protein
LRLIADDEGALRLYQQRDRNKTHVMEIRFDPPLPSATQLPFAEAVSSFQISLDQFENLLSGEIRMRREADDVTLDWYFDEPAWARARKLRASAALDRNTVSRLEVKPIKRE